MSKIWQDAEGKWYIGGYQPKVSRLDVENPPRGGSGVPPLARRCTCAEESGEELARARQRGLIGESKL